MYIREHMRLSATAALIAVPWLKQAVAIPFAASILIDVDHYAWHAITHRTLSLRAAMKYFGQADPPQLPQMRLLHHPLVLGMLLLLALRTRSRLLWLMLGGMLFHVGLDGIHVTQMSHLKKTLSEQARHVCAGCGKEDAALQLHTVTVAPSIRDRYNPRHFVVLCPVCHEQAHSPVPGLVQGEN
jgi:hypothetical protein